MKRPQPIRIEGLTIEELLSYPAEELAGYVQAGSPVIVAVGTAEVLCEFVAEGRRLTVVLAHIDGGGEGVLRAIHQVVSTSARRLGFDNLEWVVTALHCANPNAKLKSVLERLSFRVQQTTSFGEAYVLLEQLT